MNYNSLRLDYFIIKKDQFEYDKYALQDFSKYHREVAPNFYYFNFFYLLLIEYPAIEYPRFIEYHIENSPYENGFILFLKEELIQIKKICNTKNYITNEEIITSIIKETDETKMLDFYGVSTMLDPAIQYSIKYFNQFIVANKGTVKTRIKLILNLLSTKYNSDYFKKIKPKNEEVIFDVEELETIGQKIMLMKELGIIDYLINKFDLGKSQNQLSNVIHCFTGIKKSTINPIINTWYSQYSTQKNNPYKNEKNLAKVKAKLVELQIKK